ncbi:MAG: hypothetical protein RR054_03330 [Clostridia bacterium]
MELSGYIMSIVGAAVITLLTDIIIPEGETNTYIKGILSIFIVFIIALPLPKLLKTEINFESIIGVEKVSIDYEFIDEINKGRIKEMEFTLKSALSSEGIHNCDVKIEAEFNGVTMNIKGIFVEIKNVVIDGENANINIVKRIKDIASKVCRIDKEMIKVEGRS